jgi:hypothetical protein
MKKVFLSFYLLVAAVLLFTRFAWGPVLDKFLSEQMAEAERVEHYQELSKGAFHMMYLDLLRLPEEEWKARIEALKPRFGYRIELMAYADLQLDEGQKDQLRQGRIVVVGEGDYLYYQVGESRLVLRKGPISEIEPDYKVITMMFWAITVLIMALPTVIWILPFWRKLRKISLAAIAFGNGDFNVRAVISKRSSLFIIAAAFNTMANRAADQFPQGFDQCGLPRIEITNLPHPLRTGDAAILVLD